MPYPAQSPYGLAQCREASQCIGEWLPNSPKTALVLGSGLNPVAESVDNAVFLDYADIPHFPAPNVEGHVGRLVAGTIEGQDILVLQGRGHFYEGYALDQLALPVRALKLLGLETLISTCASGGLNPSFERGDLMLITDHINLVGLMGHSPLRGPNIDELGPRFPGMTRAYSPELLALARTVARNKQIQLREGVFCCVSGPAYETPAEVRFLTAMGADAVSMSLVHEVMAANHCGIRVLGVCGITNMAIHYPGFRAETTHEEVVDAGQLLVPKLSALASGLLQGLSQEQNH
ncbi:MAG: purine-nucleoside phosphorylase [Desulfovibrio sp.]|nr:MAG: purine-nucleoside phosphorylase [Desulfovibrio sp.]